MSIYRVVSGDIICDTCGAVLGKLTYDAKDGDFLADHVTVTCRFCLLLEKLELGEDTERKPTLELGAGELEEGA